MCVCVVMFNLASHPFDQMFVYVDVECFEDEHVLLESSVYVFGHTLRQQDLFSPYVDRRKR